MGSKQIFHLEAFVAKYMRLYERYVHPYNMSMRDTNKLHSFAMGIDFDDSS